MPKLPVTLVLHNIRSLYNLGAIFRTAEAAGVEGVILSGLTALPPRPEIEKTALGALNSLQWQNVFNLPDFLRKKKEAGYTVVALEQTSTASNLYAQLLTFPLVVILGHEREGVEPAILSLCDQHIHLPQFGASVRSLNVSVAAGIFLYEAVRQFCYDKKS